MEQNEFVEFMLKKAQTKDKSPEPYQMLSPEKDKPIEPQREMSEEEMKSVQRYTEELRKQLQQ